MHAPGYFVDEWEPNDAQEGSIPEDVLSAITAQVLQGLSYLHRHKHTVSASLPLHLSTIRSWHSAQCMKCQPSTCGAP